MTLHATDLLLLILIVGAGCSTCYALLVRRLSQITARRDLLIADQLGALDAAIQALETRLAERRNFDSPEQIPAAPDEQKQRLQEGESIAGEIKAVIAAAATTLLGKRAVVKSIHSAPTPWSQQGRLLVQGSHNLRVRQ